MTKLPPDEPLSSSADATYTDHEAQSDSVAQSGRAEELSENAAGRYELGEVHGEGGLGQVLLAFDRELQRTVALKRLRHPEPGAEARFVREARITARLEHPAIVPVHDVGRHPGGGPFYAMKFVSGRSLKDAIADASSLEERLRLLPSVLAVAEAMAYAHSRSVVHRDLKPSNVVLGEFGETVVIDWGLAKELGHPDSDAPRAQTGAPISDDDLTRVGDVLGTPAYMAPEQARGETVDARADVYALGAMLYHLLAGEPPYRGRESGDVLKMVQMGAPPPVAQRAPKAAPPLVAIVDKAMARDREGRYRDASGLRDDLRRFQGGRLVQAHRYTVRQRVGRFLRRFRVPLLSGGVAAAVVGGGFLAGSTDEIAVCSIEPSELERTWPTRGERIAAAVSGSGGAESWAIARQRIDSRFAELAMARRQTCLDTQRGLQSPDLLDLRLLCLAQRDAEIEALVAQAENEPTLEVVGGVVRAVYEIPPVESCTGPEFANQAPMPADQATRDEIAAINRGVATARAQAFAGRRDGLDDQLNALARRAVAVGHAPTEASVLFTRATFLPSTGNADESLATFRAAALAADRGGDDLTRLKAEVGYARVLSTWSDRAVEAQALLPRIEAAAARVGTVEARALLADIRADITYGLGDYKATERFAEEAVELLAGLEGTAGLDTLSTLRRWGQALYEQRLADRAVEIYRVALERAERTLGSQHIEVARILGELANSMDRTKNREEVDELRERALDMTKAVMGARVTTEYVYAMLNVGVSKGKRGEHQEALDLFREALPMMEQLHGPGHTRIADVYVNTSSQLSKMGRHDEAIAEAQRAVDMYVAALGENHVRTADTLWLLGRRLEKAGRNGEAIDTYLRSARWFQRAPGASKVAPMLAWQWAANLLLAEKRWPEARRILAVASKAAKLEPDRMRPGDAAWLDFYVLQAKAAGRPPASKLRQEVMSLRDQALSAGQSDLVADIDAWLGSAGAEDD